MSFHKILIPIVVSSVGYISFAKNKFEHQQVINHYRTGIKKSKSSRDVMEYDKMYRFYTTQRNELSWFKRNFGG